MACAFTHDIFEMITMIAKLRTTCWSSDQAAARKLETPTSPDTGMVTEVFGRARGVVGGALLCSPDTTNRLAHLRTPCGRMELSNPRIVAGLGRWVKQDVQALSHALSASSGAY